MLSPPDLDSNRRNREIWEANSNVWDEEQGDFGNAFQRTLVFPAAERFLGLPGQQYSRILEIGCGNGSFARRLVDLGAVNEVVATDFSDLQLASARSRTSSTLIR